MGSGTVFALSTNGSSFTNLYLFTALTGATNSDGANPNSTLNLSADLLYGTAANGGAWGSGTVFAINTNGMAFTTLYTFTAQPFGRNSDGANPLAGLVLSGNTLFGTTVNAGNFYFGTVFSLSFKPTLSIASCGPNVGLTWPTNYAGFDYTGFILQSTTNLVSPVWTTNSPAPVVVNGQNTATNPISGNQQFFRLSQ